LFVVIEDVVYDSVGLSYSISILFLKTNTHIKRATFE